MLEKLLLVLAIFPLAVVAYGALVVLLIALDALGIVKGTNE